MRIVEAKPQPDLNLLITTTDGAVGCFDVQPYLHYEVFTALQDYAEFQKIRNGGYFVE